MSSIRLALVTRPASGGMRRHVSTLLAWLNAKEVAPTLFAPSDFTLDSDDIYVARNALPIRANTSSLHDLRTIGRLASQLRGQFDLVHAHGLRGALIGVLAAHKAKIPALFTAHNLVPHLGSVQKQALRYVGRQAALILAVSQAVADTLIAVGLPSDKIQVIPNGIDLAPFDAPITPLLVRMRYGLDPHSLLLVAAGRFAPEKGFDVLIEAFHLLRARQPAARLILAGSGPEEETLRALAAPLQNSVIFAGQMPEVVSLLQAADVVVIPSRQEGQGIVALEAMAAGKPVAASRVGGLIETIEDDKTGLLVPPEDPAALAEALASLLEDRMLCQMMGKKGRHRVELEYTASQMTRQIESAYRKVMMR